MHFRGNELNVVTDPCAMDAMQQIVIFQMNFIIYITIKTNLKNLTCK